MPSTFLQSFVEDLNCLYYQYAGSTDLRSDCVLEINDSYLNCTYTKYDSGNADEVYIRLGDDNNLAVDISSGKEIECTCFSDSSGCRWFSLESNVNAPQVLSESEATTLESFTKKVYALADEKAGILRILLKRVDCNSSSSKELLPKPIRPKLDGDLNHEVD